MARLQVLNPPRRRRRRMRNAGRRNPLWRRKRRGRRGQRPGTFSGRRAKYKLTRRPGQRGGWANNPRERRRRRRTVRYNYRGLRRIRVFNPNGLLKGFRLPAVMGTLPLVGGLIANGVVVKMLGERLPIVRSNVAATLATSLVTASALSTVTGMVMPSMASGVLIGGATYTLSTALAQVLPGGPFGECGPLGCGDGLGDFATQNQVAQARPLDAVI